MRWAIILTVLMSAPAFAHDHDPEEIVEAAIYHKSDGKAAPITNVDPQRLTNMLAMAVRRDFYQRSAPRSRVERLQGLMPRPPLPPQRSVIPELGSVVVLANTPLSGGSVGLEIDLGSDVRIAID